MLPAVIANIDNQDDQQFMMEVYQKYHRFMYYQAKKWISESPAQEDVVQDALVKLIPKAPLLRQLDDARLVSYIAHTVRNTAFKLLQRQARADRVLTDSGIDELGDKAAEGFSAPEDLVIHEEQKEAFRQIWADLPERERLLLEGKYLFHQSDEELAEWLGCKPGSVRMALTRARRAVLNELKRRENGDTSGKTPGTV